MRRSLTADLVRSAALALVVAAGAVFATWSLVIHFLPGGTYRFDLEESLDRVQGALALDATGRPQVSGLSQRHALMYQVLTQDLVYQVVTPRGEVLLSSNGDMTPLLSGEALLQGKHVIDLQRNGVLLHALAEAGKRAGAGRFVIVARSQRFEEAALDVNASTARQSAVVAAVLSMSVFAGVVIVIVNRLLRRLREACAAAALIAPANLAARLQIEGVPREIAPLIESFNAVLERLETGFRNQQEFLALAAHELKTPIALLRAQVELDGGADRAGMLADLDHMGRHVHQLLHLAEVSDVASMAPVTTDAGAVVDDALRALGRMIARQGVSVEVDDSGAPTLIQADASGLFILVRNLIENAVHHSPAGATITVTISPAGLAVLDAGPGIPKADLPLLFKRFWRGAHRLDDGAGLGLSICQEIARAHGWSICAENQPRGGAKFVVRFPAGADDPGVTVAAG